MEKKFVPSVPADVPANHEQEYVNNYHAVTRHSGNLMLFTGDQKLEHLNKDFYGPAIAAEDNDPEHLFRIAEQGRVGALATQLGLVAHYGKQYKEINYVIKLNGKTNLLPPEEHDPLSALLWDVENVVAFKKNSGLQICGIGFTLYLGSASEAVMLRQAAQAIWHAHQHGLLAVLWVYPRGRSVPEERDGELLAGAAGVAATLGADFAKINPPNQGNELSSEQWLKVAAEAAGKTRLICSGGEKTEPELFLKKLYAQIHEGTVNGSATGRNIHTRGLKEAVALTKAISAITLDNKTVDEALNLLS